MSSYRGFDRAPKLNDSSATSSGLSPSAAPLYGPQVSLTLNGEDFLPTAQVFAVTAALVTTFFDSSRLTAILPMALLTIPGSVHIKVTNPGALDSNILNFGVLERGDVNGSRTINIGDALSTALNVAGITRPALPVTVGDLNLSGSVTIGDARAIVVAGAACAVTLADMIPGGAPGDVVVLEGTGFDAATPASNVVTFTTSSGARAATVLQSGQTQLLVRIPDDAVEGNVTVRVGAQVSNPLIYKP